MKFWLPVGLLFLIGIIFSEETKDSRMMNRQQTDEWKGIIDFNPKIYLKIYQKG